MKNVGFDVLIKKDIFYYYFNEKTSDLGHFCIFLDINCDKKCLNVFLTQIYQINRVIQVIQVSSKNKSDPISDHWFADPTQIFWVNPSGHLIRQVKFRVLGKIFVNFGQILLFMLKLYLFVLINFLILSLGNDI
jgi:hypothetical protein